MVNSRSYLSVLFFLTSLMAADSFSIPGSGRPALLSTTKFQAAASAMNNKDSTSRSSLSSRMESAVVESKRTSLESSTWSSWSDGLDSRMVAEIKDELLAKYMEQGISADQAEKEIEVFLSDRERSEKYMEMRAYAQAQADDLGIEFALQLVGGFLIGFIGIAAPKYFNAFREVFPEGSESAINPLGM